MDKGFVVRVNVRMVVEAENKSDALACAEQMASEYLSTGTVENAKQNYGVELKHINYESHVF